MSKQRRVTRELLNDVSKRAQIVKLRTEIAMIDRELETIQNDFGVALYDAVDAEATSSQLPEAIFQSFEDCRTIVAAKQQEISSRHDAMDKRQSQRLRAAEPTNLSQRATRLQEIIASRSSDAKMKMEIMWLEREILREKQAFGRVVFDACMQLGHSSELESVEIEKVVDSTYELSTDPAHRKAERLDQIEQLEAALVSKEEIPTVGAETTVVEQ